MTQSLLRQWAEKTPVAPFAIFESGAAWSYLEALQLSWSIGAGLRRIGVSPGEPVLSFLPNGEEAVALMLGANAAGAVYAPLNVAYRMSFLQHAINVPRAAVLVAHASLVDRITGLDLPYLKTIVVVGGGGYRDDHRLVIAWSDLQSEAPAPPPSNCRREPTDDMTYIYTSGTTGPSKAVRCSYNHHEAYAKWFGHGDIGADDRAFVCLPMFHVGGTGWLYTMLFRGGSIAVVPRFSTERYWPMVRKLGATTGTIMAAMATFLMREPERPDDADNPIRIALLVPHIPQVEEFRRRFDITLWSGFAMSEVPGPLRTALGASNLKSAGIATTPAWSLRLVDSAGNDVPDGAVGELRVRHEQPGVITAGYVNMPEATAEAWAGGWFHTGDLFRRDSDGEYYFVDRNKDALRRRGENISSMEVEAQIVKHPAVLEAAIVGVPADEMEDDVLAFVVLKPGQELAAQDLFDYLVPRLPHFMVPRYIEFLDSMPRTPTEKVMKGELRTRGVGKQTWDSRAAGNVLKADGLTAGTRGH